METRATENESPSTKQRLLDTVEKMLTERHEVDVSLRDITTAAGVNVAAVSYHFGSKDALVAMVIEQSIERVARRQLERLQALEERSAPPAVAEVIAAWLEPAFAARGNERTAVMAQVFQRSSARRGALAEKIYEQVRRKLYDQLMRCMPDIAAEELKFRISATRIAVAGFMSTIFDHPAISHGATLSGSKKTRERILAFLVRAISDPPVKRAPR